MKIKLFLFFLLIGCASAYASNCNPSDQSGCPAACPATQGSTTAATISNSGWTQGATTITGVDCLNHVEYHHSVCPYTSAGASESDCTYDVYYPHGATLSTLFPIVCIHGGGGYIGSAPGCWGYQANTTIADVVKVQEYQDTQNPVGGKGIAIYDVNYRLTAGGLTWNANVFPAQWQDIKCFMWHILANGLGTTLPGSSSIVGVYGPSWGAQMAWWLTNTSDTLYTSSCSDSAPTNDPKYRAVMAWDPWTWMLPVNNAGWDNAVDSSHFHQAIVGQLASTTESVLQANSTSMNAEPWQQITQGNYATILNSQDMFQFGANDPLIVPYWGSGATYGGHLVEAVSTYAALSPPIHPYVELIPNCVHECDIGQLNPPSQIDAINFLLGSLNQSQSGGTGGSSGVTGTGR